MFLKADISDIACSDKCHRQCKCFMSNMHDNGTELCNNWMVYCMYLFSLDNYVDKENYFADKYITSKTLYVDQWYL